MRYVFVVQLIDGLLPNLVVSSSQHTSADKRRHIFSTNTSVTDNTARPQAAPYPYNRPVSVVHPVPPPDYGFPRTEGRIVPVFKSKVRATVPRGTTSGVVPPAEDPVKSQTTVPKSSNFLQPGGSTKPTFSKAPSFPRKPVTGTSAACSRAIGPAPKNPATCKPQNHTKSAGLDSSDKMNASKFSASRPSSTMPSENVNTCSKLPAFSSSKSASTSKTTTKCTDGVTSQPSSVFSVSEVVDLTVESRHSCSGQQLASLNRHAGEDRGKTTAAHTSQVKPACQKRKPEVHHCFIAGVLVLYFMCR